MNQYEIAKHLLKHLAFVKADVALLKRSISSEDFKDDCSDFQESVNQFETTLNEAKLQYSDVLDEVFTQFSRLKDQEKISYIEELIGIHIFPQEKFNEFMTTKLHGDYFAMAQAVSMTRYSSDFNPYYPWFSWVDHDRYPLKGDLKVENLIPDRRKFLLILIRDGSKMKHMGYTDAEITEIQRYFTV